MYYLAFRLDEKTAYGTECGECRLMYFRTRSEIYRGIYDFFGPDYGSVIRTVDGYISNYPFIRMMTRVKSILDGSGNPAALSGIKWDIGGRIFNILACGTYPDIIKSLRWSLPDIFDVPGAPSDEGELLRTFDRYVRNIN